MSVYEVHKTQPSSTVEKDYHLISQQTFVHH